MDIKFHHIAFNVSDLERTIAFYQDNFDLEFGPIREIGDVLHERLTGVQGFKARVASCRIGSFEIEFMQTINPPVHSPISEFDIGIRGYSHLAFACRDPAALYNRLKAAGVQFLPGSTPTFFFVRDPDDHIIEVG